MNNYSYSAIQEARDGDNMRHGVVNNDIRTLGEGSAASSTEVREENIRPPVRGWVRHRCWVGHWGSNCCQFV